MSRGFHGEAKHFFVPSPSSFTYLLWWKRVTGLERMLRVRDVFSSQVVNSLENTLSDKIDVDLHGNFVSFGVERQVPMIQKVPDPVAVPQVRSRD